MRAHVWQQADDVIVKTLIAAEPRLRRRAFQRQRACAAVRPFELFGFDLLIDADQRVWLLEVNTLPSLESSSSLDYDVKSNVITDFFNMLQIELFERPQDVFRSTRVRYPSGAVERSPVHRPRDERVLRRERTAAVRASGRDAMPTGG